VLRHFPATTNNYNAWYNRGIVLNRMMRHRAIEA
jgi:hypothetical protein